MHLMDPMATCPFVDETLRDLRREVGPFVGLFLFKFHMCSVGRSVGGVLWRGLMCVLG